MKALAIDLGPLRRSKDYRYLYFGQLVSHIGGMISNAAFPFQVYQKTHSSAYVGLVGIIQLLPITLFGIIGGDLADRYDRRKIVLVAESVMLVLALLLAWTATNPSVSVVVLFSIAAISACAFGIHRPALTAMIPKLVSPEDLPAVASLGGLSGTLGMVLGPSLGGLLIAAGGVTTTYLVDAATFVVSLLALSKIKAVTKAKSIEQKEPDNKGYSKYLDGLRYALKRPVLWGSYLADVIAMTFVFPVALYPALAESYGGAKALGPLYAAGSVGAFIASATSGWCRKITRYGLMITLAAMGWCLAMVGFGLSTKYGFCVMFLGLAGYADMISAVYRQTLWNKIIPDAYRGRLASVEMLSYLFGPMLGMTLMGFAGSILGPKLAVLTGGLVGCALLIVCLVTLKAFIRYDGSD